MLASRLDHAVGPETIEKAEGIIPKLKDVAALSREDAKSFDWTGFIKDVEGWSEVLEKLKRAESLEGSAAVAEKLNEAILALEEFIGTTLSPDHAEEVKHVSEFAREAAKISENMSIARASEMSFDT